MVKSPINFLIDKEVNDDQIKDAIIFFIFCKIICTLLPIPYILNFTVGDFHWWQNILANLIKIVGYSVCVWISFRLLREKVKFKFAFFSMCYILGVSSVGLYIGISVGYGFISITHPYTFPLIKRIYFQYNLKNTFIVPLRTIEKTIGKQERFIEKQTKNPIEEYYQLAKKLKVEADEIERFAALMDKRKEKVNKEIDSKNITKEENRKLVNEFIQFQNDYIKFQLLTLKHLSIMSSGYLLFGMLFITLSIITVFIYIISCWRVFEKRYLIARYKGYLSFVIFLPFSYVVVVAQMAVMSLL